MPPAGRPRTFDREQALMKAMHVFWEKGYEGTTMADLIETIGIKAPGVYAAFGNKDKLFREVVALYKSIVEAGPLKVLNDHENIYTAVEKSLKVNVEVFSGAKNPAACLIMTAAINCAPEHAEHIEALKALRNDYKNVLKARFEKARADDQLGVGASPAALAEFFSTVIQGLALRAKDGSGKKDLQSSVVLALASLKASMNPAALLSQP